MSRVAQMALLGTGGVAAPAALAFEAITTNPTEGQTITFTGVAIGAAASDRYVFVAIPYYNGGTSNISIASVTIGGVLATIYSQPFNASAIRGGAALVSALVPTGTTADIVITYAASGSFFRPRIAVYRVTGLQSNSPVEFITKTGVDNNIPLTLTVNAVQNGIVFLVCNVYGNISHRTLTGLTQDYMVSPVSSLVYIGGGGTVSATGAFNATISDGTTANWAAVMASFR